MHHTGTDDGHSAGYEVILMISFVICHDKQAGGMAYERQKGEVVETSDSVITTGMNFFPVLLSLLT